MSTQLEKWKEEFKQNLSLLGVKGADLAFMEGWLDTLITQIATQSAEAERTRIRSIVQPEIDNANNSVTYRPFSSERNAYKNGSRTAAMYIQKALDEATTTPTTS